MLLLLRTCQLVRRMCSQCQLRGSTKKCCVLDFDEIMSMHNYYIVVMRVNLVHNADISALLFLIGLHLGPSLYNSMAASNWPQAQSGQDKLIDVILLLRIDEASAGPCDRHCKKAGPPSAQARGRTPPCRHFLFFFSTKRLEMSRCRLGASIAPPPK